MADYRCVSCRQVYIENMQSNDLYCQHSAAVDSQNKQFIAEDRVRELEQLCRDAEKLFADKELADMSDDDERDNIDGKIDSWIERYKKEVK